MCAIQANIRGDTWYLGVKLAISSTTSPRYLVWRVLLHYSGAKHTSPWLKLCVCVAQVFETSDRIFCSSAGAGSTRQIDLTTYRGPCKRISQDPLFSAAVLGQHHQQLKKITVSGLQAGLGDMPNTALDRGI